MIAQRIGGFVVGILLLSSCGIGSSGSGVSQRSSLDHQLLGVPVSVDFRPEVHGFSFPNFDNRAYLQSFDAHALVSVLGTGPRICVDGTVGEPVEEGWLMEGSDQPCEVTPEAAEFIEMVESARIAGHCEGLVVLAALRYTWDLDPVTAELAPDERTINAIIRAFATIFLPEVQAEARSWIATSLADTVEVLATALSAGSLDYGMGLYLPEGGHEVLPYAITYPRENLARIAVYDSNWPGVERFIELDLSADTWRFSFGGDDPETDPFAWEGTHEDLDLNSIQVRIDALEARGVNVTRPTN
jgi:hypothetical protein